MRDGGGGTARLIVDGGPEGGGGGGAGGAWDGAEDRTGAAGADPFTFEPLGIVGTFARLVGGAEEEY